MEEDTRGEMEAAFGVDFSDVNIHKDGEAAELNEQLSARAFTLGNDVYFSEGSYQPSTRDGKTLLGHELTHVVQQRSGRVSAGAQAQGMAINGEDTLEEEAHDIGNTVALGKYDGPILSEDRCNSQASSGRGVPQLSRAIQRWGELQDTPLVSPYFRGDPRFEAVLGDPPRLIRRGQEGPHIRRLQEALIELRYRLPEHGVDGIFGPETETSVRNFQMEAGAPEDARDGVVGPDTLRELDQRFATAHRSRIISVAPSGARSQGNNFVFNVPVTRAMGEEDFLIVSLRHIFPVADIEAHVLAREGWGFVRFTPLTEADVQRGFRPVAVPVSDYETVAGEARRRFSGRTSPEDEERFQEELETSLHNLTGTDDIYRLNQEIEQKRSVLDAIRGTSIRDSGIDYEYRQRRIAELETELAALIRRRDAALGRVGITQEIYQQQQADFKRNFSLYAIRVAQRMLRENEASAGVEATRYRNLDRVNEVKQIFSELNNIYLQADRERAAGIQHEINELDQSVRFSGYARQIAEAAFGPFQFPDGRRGGNAHWEASWDHERRAFDRLQEAARTYPILAHPELRIRRNARRYSSLSASALARVLQEQLTDVTESIEQIRSSLNTQNIWELEAVIGRAKYELGILDGSIQATVVADGIREARSRTTIRNLLLAAAGIGLGLLALASGPVGWAALGASIAVGAVDAYLVYQDISFTRAARRTSVDPEDALTSLDASWVWFGVSLVCIGIDVAAAVKIAKGFRAAARAGTSTELQAEAIRVVDAATEVSEEAAAGVIYLPNRAEVLALLESQRAIDTLRLVRGVEDSAAAARLASAMEENAELLPALLRVEQISAETVRLYAGTLHNVVNQLPRVLRVSDLGNLASNPQLYEMLLSDPRVQRVLLDNADNPRLLLDDWATWQRATTRARNPVTSTFPEYLSRGLGHRTRVEGSAQLLTDLFGAGFHSLSNFNKNLQVLRQTADELVDALNAGSLPQRVHDALSEALNRNLIRGATDLEGARMLVVRAVNDAIGANVENMASYRQVMDVLQQSGSRGALGESFARVMDLIPGFRSARRMTIGPFGEVGIEVLNGRRVTLDRYVAEGSIIGEIKVGSSFKRAQMLQYKALRENPEVLADYFRAAGVQGGEFYEIVYLVMPGPSSVGRTTRQYAQTVYRALFNEGMSKYSKVHYLDRDGVLWRLVTENQFEQVRRID